MSLYCLVFHHDVIPLGDVCLHVFLLHRWLKYEEKVDSANRWSKPHVSTTSLHSLFEVQRMLKGDRSACVFDLDLESGLQQHVAGITPKVLLPPEPQRDGDPAWTNLVKLIGASFFCSNL